MALFTSPLKNKAIFEKRSLSDHTKTAQLKDLDLIVESNVWYYLDDEQKMQQIERASRLLRSGGSLILDEEQYPLFIRPFANDIGKNFEVTDRYVLIRKEKPPVQEGPSGQQ